MSNMSKKEEQENSYPVFPTPQHTRRAQSCLLGVRKWVCIRDIGDEFHRMQCLALPHSQPLNNTQGSVLSPHLLYLHSVLTKLHLVT